MRLKTKLFGHVYEFKDIKEVLGKANEEKSGDKLAGICATSMAERVAAREVLGDIILSDLRNNPVIPYEEDEVTRVIQDSVNEKIYNGIKNWSVSELREWILLNETSETEIRRISNGLTSEMIAAVTKIMSNLDLIYAANKIRVTAHCNTTIGQRGTIAFRLQPNHPTDDLAGIEMSLYEGLSYGAGDALIGLNPVDDSVSKVASILDMFARIKQEWNIPTQICVLAHLTTQMEAVRKGAPTDLLFQSIAGSEKGNEAFGISVKILDEAQQLISKYGTSTGPNFMYFETGQGAELSSSANYGADQVTMEARCYGLARRYSPFMVNTVVGFIGPEYLYDSKEVVRAGLEDHFMGKLTGISMGVDACYTNHMKVDQNDIENLAVLLAAAGCNFFIGVPHGDDVMLNYQSAGYHDAATLRQLLGLKPSQKFEIWMEEMGLWKDGRLTGRAGDATIFIK